MVNILAGRDHPPTTAHRRLGRYSGYLAAPAQAGSGTCYDLLVSGWSERSAAVRPRGSRLSRVSGSIERSNSSASVRRPSRRRGSVLPRQATRVATTMHITYAPVKTPLVVRIRTSSSTVGLHASTRHTARILPMDAVPAGLSKPPPGRPAGRPSQPRRCVPSIPVASVSPEVN